MAKKHLCEMCRPYQRDLNRLRVAGLFGRRESRADVEVATYKLGVVRELVCSDSPPDLDEAYRPGGKRREWFLANRITAKCPSCQRLADELVIVAESARSFRAALQEQRQDQSDENAPGAASLGHYAALQTHHARALEQLLRECERVKCRPVDEPGAKKRG